MDKTAENVDRNKILFWNNTVFDEINSQADQKNDTTQKSVTKKRKVEMEGSRKFGVWKSERAGDSDNPFKSF